MTTPLQIGVIGIAGRGGHLGYEAQQQTAGLIRFTAGVEIDDARYHQACDRWGIRPRCYPTIRDMLAHEHLDGVIIGTPNALHLQNLRELEGTDLPILLEKPLDSSFEKVCEVMRWSLRRRAPILVGHCMRYAPILRKAKDIIASGSLGRVASARFVQHCHYGNAMFHGAWRRTREGSGTMLLEKATHDFDILDWLVRARPVRVTAIQRQHAFGGDKPDDLTCGACAERFSCPESSISIMARNDPRLMLEGKDIGANAACVYSRCVSTPDNDACLVDFDTGSFATYMQDFFAPRSFHHRVYEIVGTLGAMEIDLGESKGCITVCPRFGAPEDRTHHHFDYLGRNHYNGDAFMVPHLYEVFTGRAKPHSTVAQAFVAEMAGFAGVRSSDTTQVVDVRQMVPADLRHLWTDELFADG